MRSKNQSQQILLRFLGFYQGKCDGIWGPDSVTAKRKYEASESYSPGIPSNGMPFPDRGPTPHGVYRVPGKPGILRHTDMPNGYEEELLAQLVTEESARKLNDDKHNKKSGATTASQLTEDSGASDISVDAKPHVPAESNVDASVQDSAVVDASVQDSAVVDASVQDSAVVDKEALRRDRLRRQQQSSGQHKRHIK